MGGYQHLQINHWIEKKRQNHELFGQIMLVQNTSCNKFFTIKHIKKEQQQKIEANIVFKHIEKPYLQVHKVDQTFNKFTHSLSNNNKPFILFDSVQIDLQTIECWPEFNGFNISDVVNIMYHATQGLIELQKYKLNVMPISRKTVIGSFKNDSYEAQDLSTIVFKLIPMKLVDQHLVSNFSGYVKVPPQLKNQKHIMQIFKTQNNVYCLGVLALELLHNSKNKNNEQQNFPQSKLVSVINRMIENETKNRIKINDLLQNIQQLKYFANIQANNKIKHQQNINSSYLQISNRQNNKNIELKQNIEIRRQQMGKLHSQCRLQNTKQTDSNHHILSQNQQFYSPNIILKATRRKPKRILFENGAAYEGQFDQHNNFDGFGTLYYRLQQICYTGYWKLNKFHGFGYLYNNNKQNITSLNHIKKWNYYEGQFDCDRKHGYGRLHFNDGSKYQGNFQYDQIKGFGTYTDQNNCCISKVWQNELQLY